MMLSYIDYVRFFLEEGIVLKCLKNMVKYGEKGFHYDYPVLIIMYYIYIYIYIYIGTQSKCTERWKQLSH